MCEMSQNVVLSYYRNFDHMSVTKKIMNMSPNNITNMWEMSQKLF